jgi:hypothetical protein
MEKIHEPNASLFNYLMVALVINYKEWVLRIKENKIRFSLIVLIGLLLFTVKWVYLIYFSFLAVIVITDFVIELFRYGKMAVIHKNKYPEGIILEFDDEGFIKHTKTGHQWPKTSWNAFKIAFDNKVVKNIALYHGETKEYHLFFAQKMATYDYLRLREVIRKKIRHVY